MTERTYTVHGMDCADCARNLEKGINRLDDVQGASVDFATGKLRLRGTATLEALQQRAAALGYRLDDGETVSNTPEHDRPGGVIGFWWYLLSRWETRLALVGGLIILLATLARFLVPGDVSVPVTLAYSLALLVAVYPIARSGLRTLFINRDFNINLLMTIAAGGALIIGEHLEAATVIFLFAIGEALEGYTADRARGSLRELLALAPPRAIRLSGDPALLRVEEEVPVEALRVGDTILVKPGERIPMDGRVLRGESGVNQAPITGESIPVHKEGGHTVFAGTVNGDGALEIEVTHLAADNTLNRIIKLVEEAQSVRAPSQRVIDRFARVYTPAVVAAAALVAVIPPLVFGAPFYDTAAGPGWLYRALALLVIACPCALVISTPVTIISAITAAARRGVLIKGGTHLEALGRVRAVAFDKTGTLTRGQPVVTQYRSVECQSGQGCDHCDDLLALAAAVERRSAHPLAQAVVAAAEARGVGELYAPAEAVESLAGRGVRGVVDGRRVTIGSHQLFDERYPHSDEVCAWVRQAEADGQTTMLLEADGQVCGFVAVADQPRADSRGVIAELQRLGLETVMLTGDNAVVAGAVGSIVGVDDVRAGLLPEDKVTAVRGLLAEHKQVAMVGDGVNDTPALAAATVGVAMGGAGSAQALETADIALMADDLKQLPYAVRLARLARTLIRQNVALSLALKLVFMILALLGGATMWMAVLADMGMSLAVTLNGMRPLRHR